MQMRLSLAIGVLLMCSAGCGKYGPPVSPETRAPKAVPELTATPLADHVSFSWKSAEVDRRGDELKVMDGYRVYQKELGPGAPADWQKGFSLLGTVQDTHVAVLQRLREEARAKGALTRRVSVDAKLKQFTFATPPLKVGQVYLFKVVPFNQGGVEGDARQLVRVAFQGPQSVMNYIQLAPEDQLDVR